MIEWQDISTAPMSNGSKAFLAYVPGHGPVVAIRFLNGKVHSNSRGLAPLPKAAFWMYLPTPPTTNPDSSLTPP